MTRPHWKKRLNAYPVWKKKRIALFTVQNHRWLAPPWWWNSDDPNDKGIFSRVFGHLKKDPRVARYKTCDFTIHLANEQLKEQ